MILIHLADPLDVLITNIIVQMQLFEDDRDPARVDAILRMEQKALCIEYGFRTNMN